MGSSRLDPGSAVAGGRPPLGSDVAGEARAAALEQELLQQQHRQHRRRRRQLHQSEELAQHPQEGHRKGQQEGGSQQQVVPGGRASEWADTEDWAWDEGGRGVAADATQWAHAWGSGEPFLDEEREEIEIIDIATVPFAFYDM